MKKAEDDVFGKNKTITLSLSTIHPSRSVALQRMFVRKHAALWLISVNGSKLIEEVEEKKIKHRKGEETLLCLLYHFIHDFSLNTKWIDIH